MRPKNVQCAVDAIRADTIVGRGSGSVWDSYTDNYLAQVIRGEFLGEQWRPDAVIIAWTHKIQKLWDVRHASLS